MSSLTNCLTNTKFRVFEVGDKIVHSAERHNVCTISSFFKDSYNDKKLMHLEGCGRSRYSPAHWSKVSEKK